MLSLHSLMYAASPLHLRNGDTMRSLGIEHAAAKKLKDKLVDIHALII